MSDTTPTTRTTAPETPRAAIVERHVLGTLLAYPAQSKAIGLPLLIPNDFYEIRHRLIFQAIVAVNESGAEADVLAVVEILRQTHQLDALATGAASGAHFVAVLTNGSNHMPAPSPANLVQYCRILNEFRARRAVLGLAQELLKRLRQDDDVFELLTTAEETFAGISQSFTRTELRTLKQAVMGSTNYLFDRFSNPNRARVSFGLPVLDDTTGGLEPGDVVVIGGRPGMSKTDVLVHFARHNGLVQGIPGVVFSLEMTAIQMGFRFLSLPSGVPANTMRRTITKDHLYQVANAAEQMQNADLIVLDDSPAHTISSLRAVVTQAKAKYPTLGWVGADYLQLIRGHFKKGGNPEAELAEISTGLKAMAKELGLVILELSQLNRDVDKRNPPVPVKTDLRGSGQIEQDADFIIFPWRPDYYGLDTSSTGEPILPQELPEYIEFIVDKNRHDAPGVAVARYFPRESRFVNWPSTAIEAYTAAGQRLSSNQDFDNQTPQFPETTEPTF